MKRICAIALLSALAAAQEGDQTVSVERLTQKTGEWWYAMNDPEGKPRGYAHLAVREREGGGVRVAWELKITWEAGNYEEQRTMDLGADWGLKGASYSTGGKLVAERGEQKHRPADAATGMVFVFAAFLPQEKGLKFTRTELSEDKNFESLGTTHLLGTGPEKLGQAEVFRFDLRREDGQNLPIWVNARGEIRQVDWGGKNMMVLAKESTKHLYRPAGPSARQRRSHL
jgi:hypothetical protein